MCGSVRSEVGRSAHSCEVDGAVGGYRERQRSGREDLIVKHVKCMLVMS